MSEPNAEENKVKKISAEEEAAHKLEKSIRRLVRFEVESLLLPMEARFTELASIVLSLKVENASLRARQDAIENTPRVLVDPKFEMPVPVVHVGGPVVQVPKPEPRKPMKRKTTKLSDGSFVTEEIE